MEGKDKILGYLRKDGGKGIRNKILVIYTSGCAASAAFELKEAFAEKADIDVIGTESCRRDEAMARKLKTFATHQNVGAVLVVRNGCEETDGREITEAAADSGRPCGIVDISRQGSPGAVREGLRLLNGFLDELAMVPRVPISLPELVIGVECGGSDFTSGLAANRLVGEFADYAVKQGGTVLFEEMYEAMGLKDYLLSRCETEKAKKQIGETYDKFYRHALEEGQFSISPGNIRGGLTTIEEKSMGAVVKSGTQTIQGVLKICERPPCPGLWHLDCMGDTRKGCGFPVSNDASSTLMFLLSGAHMTILTTGRGHVISNPVGPVFKLTGNPWTYESLKDDIDFDASPLLTGEQSVAGLLDRLMALVMETAGGRRCKGERNGHAEGVLNHEIQYGPGEEEQW